MRDIDWAQVAAGVAIGYGLARAVRALLSDAEAPRPRKIADGIDDLVGDTPLLRLSRSAPEHNILGKCEFMSVYSLKDRPVRQIIAEAEAAGTLAPGGTLIETTSGNTGMAVASQAAAKGYKAVLCMCEIQSEERRAILRALGAELVLSPRDEGTKGAKRLMHELMERHPEYAYVGQHQNLANPRAHYLTTGPEIWRDTAGQVDIMVAPLGTGGTLCGTGRYLKALKPSVRLVAVEPAEAPMVKHGRWAPHRMMGTSPGFVPATLSAEGNRELIDEIFLVSEDEAFEQCRQVARTEGLLVGISASAALFAARAVAAREENRGKCVVVVLCDSGERYLSVGGLFQGARA